MNQQVQDLANIPFFVPTGPASAKPLKEGVYLAKIIRADIKEVKKTRKLLVTYEAVWSADANLLENIGGKTTEFIDLEGEHAEIGSEKINRLRITVGKQDSKSSADFEGEYVMLCMKVSKKNPAYTNVSYIAPVPDDVSEAYNEYVAKFNAELVAESKDAGSDPDYDPDVGF